MCHKLLSYKPDYCFSLTMLNSGGYMKKPASLFFHSLSEQIHNCCQLFLNFLSNDQAPQQPYSCKCESLIYENYEPTYSFELPGKFTSQTYMAARHFELCSNI